MKKQHKKKKARKVSRRTARPVTAASPRADVSGEGPSELPPVWADMLAQIRPIVEHYAGLSPQLRADEIKRKILDERTGKALRKMFEAWIDGSWRGKEQIAFFKMPNGMNLAVTVFPMSEDDWQRALDHKKEYNAKSRSEWAQR